MARTTGEVLRQLVGPLVEKRRAARAGRKELPFDGCWCDGVFTSRRATSESDPEMVWNHFEYCICTEGRQARADVEEQAHEGDREFWEGYRSGIWQMCGVPKRFRDWTLESSPKPDAIKPPYLRSMYLDGPVGVGKTGIAVGVMREVVFSTTQPLKALFVTAPDLLQSLKDRIGKSDGVSLGDMLWRYEAADFLVLDDIGSEKATEWAQQTLFQLVNHRFTNDLATVYTSNLSLAALASHIGERTADRIAEQTRGSVFSLRGPSLRRD